MGGGNLVGSLVKLDRGQGVQKGQWLRSRLLSPRGVTQPFVLCSHVCTEPLTELEGEDGGWESLATLGADTNASNIEED